MNILLPIASLLLVTLVPPLAGQQSSVDQWLNVTLKGVQDSRLSAPAVARALAIVDTCMYDAWAAYDANAFGTQLKDVLRRPSTEQTNENKEQAISFAAFRALVDVLPVDTKSLYIPLLKGQGYDPNDKTTDITKPSGIGNVACAAVLEYRHHDNSNQLGDLNPGPYTDWTGYAPRNKPTSIPVLLPTPDPDHWQPLTFINGAAERVTQTFAGAQWGRVVPFALDKGSQFRSLVSPLGPARFGTPAYEREVEETVQISAGLTDRQKMISEFWTDGVYSEQPPGHWMRIAEWVSKRDRHTLDEDVKFFFSLSNAMLDAGIAAWDSKIAYDSVRPISAVTSVYRGKLIKAWGGPGKGTVEMHGAHWMPYQEADSPTPPFPEFVSGHSAYSAAAAEILRSWTKSDVYGGSVTFAAGQSKIEPGITPHEPVTLQWATFTEAADEAGMSRRYGGIHFRAGDQAGRILGKRVAEEVWKTANAYFQGTSHEPRLLATTVQH
jgi:hypothetical protein